jgi:dihydrofolate reductase
MTVSLVAAVGRNGVIGRDGGLPWERTGDQVHFKALTLDHVLVMGRRTYESIGRPLPRRTTVVVTRRPDWSAPEGVLVAHDIASALDLAATVDDEVFVIGGAEVYAATLPFADRLVLTEVDQAPDGDTFFPAYDRSAWQETARETHQGFAIVTYERGSDQCAP